MFLKKDIKVVRVKTTDGVKVNHYFHDNLSEMVDNSTTLFIASKTNIHFQSLLELKKQKLKKPKKKAEQGQEDRKCPNCMKPFEHLLKHIGKSSCRGKVDEKFIQDLRNYTEIGRAHV